MISAILKHSRQVIGSGRKESGFTFAEFMISMTVFAVLAGIAIPNFIGRVPKHRVNGAVRQLVAELHLAKMRAVSENNDYVIIFNTGSNRYQIHDDDNNSGAWETGERIKTVNVDDEFAGIAYGFISGTQQVEGGGSIGAAVTFLDQKVTFKSTGLADKVGSVYLKPAADTSRSDRQRAVAINQTGRIRAYWHTGDEWR